MADNKNTNDYPDEEMTVELNLDDGSNVICNIVTIFEVGGADYVALQPQNQNPLSPEQEVWFYRYSENPNNPDEEPLLEYIDDDLEYEIVLDAFEEYLDNQLFDDLDD